MKRVIALLSLVLFLFVGLVACSQTESADKMKSNLKDAGYTVTEYAPAEFDVRYSTFGGTAKIEGLKTVIVAQKEDKGIFLFVFENCKQAQAAATDEFLGALGASAKAYSDEGQASMMGYHNNVIWSESEKARDIAGLKPRH